MPKSKQLIIDFYQVVDPKGKRNSINFETCLRNIAKLSTADRTWKKKEDTLVRIHNFNDSNGFLEGDFIRLNLDDVPFTGSIDREEVEPIELSRNQGWGNGVAFLFDTSKNLLIFQAKRSVLTASIFIDYITIIGQLDFSPELLPVFKPDTLERLNRLTDVKKFELSIASTINQADLGKAKGDSTHKILDVAGDFEAPKINIVLSVGYHRNESLSFEKVKSAIRTLLPVRGHDVTKLQVSGYDDDNEKDLIDLIKDRLRVIISVDMIDKYIPYESRKAALNKALNLQKKFLDKIIRNEFKN